MGVFVGILVALNVCLVLVLIEAFAGAKNMEQYWRDETSLLRQRAATKTEKIPLRSNCPGCGHHSNYHAEKPGSYYADTGCGYAGVKMFGPCSCAASRDMVLYDPEPMTKIV